MKDGSPKKYGGRLISILLMPLVFLSLCAMASPNIGDGRNYIFWTVLFVITLAGLIITVVSFIVSTIRHKK